MYNTLLVNQGQANPQLHCKSVEDVCQQAVYLGHFMGISGKWVKVRQTYSHIPPSHLRGKLM